MIIYQASKSQFLHHALRDDIEDVVSRQYRSMTGHGVSPSEIQAWKHSLLEMAKVLGDDEIPDDAGVAIEYQLPQSSKRIDFVITGEDASARTKVSLSCTRPTHRQAWGALRPHVHHLIGRVGQSDLAAYRVAGTERPAREVTCRRSRSPARPPCSLSSQSALMNALWLSTTCPTFGPPDILIP